MISLRNRIGLDLFRVYRSLQSSLHELTYLFWECTLRCNLHCLHCGSDCSRNSIVKDMPLADFLRVLDQVAEVRDPHKTMIAVTGGEPLVRSDLAVCGKELYRRGFPWGMVTNGYDLSASRAAELFDAGLRSVSVSLDGMSESHDWLRARTGSFDRALQALRICAGNRDTITEAVTCVNMRNISELDAMKKLLTESAIPRWRLLTIFPKGRAAGVPDLSLGKEELLKLLEFIAAGRREKTIDISYQCEGFIGPWEGKVRDGYFFCRAGVNIASVLADGTISACPSMRGSFIEGSIYRDRFIDVWHSGFSKMRNRSWTKVGKCAQCKVYRWCEGNGLHLWEVNSSGPAVCQYGMLQ